MHREMSNYASKAYFLGSQEEYLPCTYVLGKGGSPSKAQERNGNTLLALGDISGGIEI